MAACDIIIPYYQSDSGVLRRAIDSVFAQSFEDFRLIIVDDGSPCPVDVDLRGLDDFHLAKIHVIRQANTGVSGARNAALRAVSPEAQCIALLDSDDEWTRDHLARAHAAITRGGGGVYWDGVTGEEGFDTDSAPSAVVGAANLGESDVEGCATVMNLPRVLTGEWWRHMHLSCTAVSADLARTIRFREHLSFCEDFAFFMDCAAQTSRALVSDAPGVVRGEGDNVWHGVGPDDTRYADEKFNMTRLLKELSASQELEERDRTLIEMRRQVCREQFYWNQVHRFKKGDGLMLGHWSRWIARDPALAKLAFGLIFKTNKNGGKTVIPEHYLKP